MSVQDAVQEHPDKTRLRNVLYEALEAAGFDAIRPPTTIHIPPSSGVRANIAPDAQAMIGEHVFANYYLRIDSTVEKLIPGWLIGIARYAATTPDQRIYLASGQDSITLTNRCKTSGIGHVVVKDQVIYEKASFSNSNSDALKERVAIKVKQIRLSLSTREVELRAYEENNLTRLRDLTMSLPPEEQTDFLSNSRSSLERLAFWVSSISDILDQALADTDYSLTSRAQQLLDLGPPNE